MHFDRCVHSFNFHDCNSSSLCKDAFCFSGRSVSRNSSPHPWRRSTIETDVGYHLMTWKRKHEYSWRHVYCFKSSQIVIVCSALVIVGTYASALCNTETESTTTICKSQVVAQSVEIRLHKEGTSPAPDHTFAHGQPVAVPGCG